MKPLLTLFLLLLTAPVLAAQSRTGLEERQLRGPVQSIRSELETTRAGEGTKRVPVEVAVFDERGNITRQEWYKPDGTLKFKYLWGHEYDEQGREVKLFYYNARGGLTNTGVSVFDENGRVTQTTQINPDGSINHIRAYFYDERGNMIREAHRNANGSARNTINRSYNDRGEVTEEIFLGANGELHHRNVLARDDHGRQTGWGLFKSDGTSKQVFRSSHVYDEHGNIKESTSYLNDASVVAHETFTYELDQHGNWTKRTTRREVFKEGRSQTESEITYRTIAYF